MWWMKRDKEPRNDVAVILTHDYKTSLQFYLDGVLEYLNIPGYIITPETVQKKWLEPFANHKKIIIRNNDAFIDPIVLNNSKLFNSIEYRERVYNKNEMVERIKKMNSGMFKYSFINKEEAYKDIANNKPLIVKTYNHESGDGVFLTNSKNELDKIISYYNHNLLYERFIPFQEEKRILVLGTKYVPLRKVLNCVGDYTGKFIRNSHSGFGYDLGFDNSEIIEKIIEEIKNEFKLSFFTIDLGYYCGANYLIEVNSRLMLNKFPDLNVLKIVQEKFAESIKDIFNDKSIWEAKK